MELKLRLVEADLRRFTSCYLNIGAVTVIFVQAMDLQGPSGENFPEAT